MDNSRPTALITGASSGIGEALAMELAKRGHDLVLVARRQDRLRAIARELKADHGIKVRVMPADLTLPGAASALREQAVQAGITPQVLVNNAGVLEQGSFSTMDVAKQQRMVQLNIAAATDMLAQFLPGMLEMGSGRILNVASIAAFMPVAGLATYAASKAYVLSLSESLMEELRGTGVTVTALCPGVTATEMISKAGAENPAIANLPSALVSDPQEVAALAVRGLLRGQPIIVPGIVNQGTTLLSRSTPKWLVRRISGILGRSQL